MKTTRPPAVDASDIVAIPVKPGLVGLVWVITASARDGYNFFVMTGSWPTLPTAEQARTAVIAPHPHSDVLLPGQADLWKGWFAGRVPREFAVVATRAATPELSAIASETMGTMIFGTAKGLRDELLRTWRLEHEPAAVQAEWDAAEARRNAQEAARRAALTLPMLLRERLFPDWSEHVSPNVLRAVRQIFRDATKDLIALAREGTPRERASVLKRITTDLNALDDGEGFIDTVEREELVECIEELARVVKQNNKDERLTGHRDW